MYVCKLFSLKKQSIHYPRVENQIVGCFYCSLKLLRKDLARIKYLFYKEVERKKTAGKNIIIHRVHKKGMQIAVRGLGISDLHLNSEWEEIKLTPDNPSRLLASQIFSMHELAKP